MALAIYRKYRPKKLADVLGQEEIVKILRNAAANDRLAHAYLFYGPRGSGKTTTARILAKVANCDERIKNQKFRIDGEPCNICRSCIEIDKGQTLDIVEIDAASNRGIDEIRDLKAGVRLAPSSLRHKIYIIDEAHQLTKDAFNALLKTLEEPPSHAIFILVTTESEKIPPTIASRAQRFHFKKLLLLEISAKLKNIAEIEKIKIDDSALELIAASADGSLRDAESLLDQIASLTQITQNNTKQTRNNTENISQTSAITLQDVEKILGQAGFSKVAALTEFLLKNDLSGALDYIAELDKGGYNIPQFNKDLIHYLRRVLVMKLAPELEKRMSRELTDEELRILKKQGQAADEKKLVGLIKSLIRAYSETRYSPFAAVPMEVAIIENLKL